MKNVNNQLKSERLIAETFELLDDVSHKFGLFEHQRYSRLKSFLADWAASDSESQSLNDNGQN